MAYSFDGHSFGQVLRDAERLFVATLEHQQRLTEVVSLLESQTGEKAAGSVELDVMSAAPALGVAIVSPHIDTSPDFVMTMRQLCVAADEQQQLAATLLTRLLGQRPAFDGERRTRGRVLIADDSDGSRETAAAILEDAGFEAFTASNGLEAVIVAHYALPEVVLMDLTMPVLTGLEAARLLRASALTRNLKVIAFTARPDLHEEAVARSFTSVLSKPATPEAIVSEVRRLAPDRVAPVGGSILDA
jgi:CheY-like chemotaxis protein